MLYHYYQNSFHTHASFREVLQIRGNLSLILLSFLFKFTLLISSGILVLLVL